VIHKLIISFDFIVGKTALASSLKQRVADGRGFFIAGKFDQVAATNQLTAKSYGPFVEAITDYVKQVVKAGTGVIASVRTALQQDMSTSELHVLLETVPLLNQILRFRKDEHMRDIVLRGTDAEERFIYIFCKFIQTITSQGYPIVLLLDDIQWMNPNAFSLMKGVASIEKTTGSRLLIICACRNDDRVSLDRLCELENGICRRAHIELSNISLNEVLEIVSDIFLFVDRDKAIRIADVIYSRTQGNPFHMLQLLKVFEKEGLMLESPGQSVENIHSKSPTIVQLLDMRIERLPNKVKDVLKVAACLGCVFADVCLVAGVFLSESEILSAIRTSESEGIIVSTDAHTYRFTHDKFQQTTYMLIPDKGKDAFHLDVGLRLWHWLPLDSRDEYLPLMGDQISRALGLVKDKEDRENLAHLFLLAGKKAAKSSSFAAAAAYLKCGIELLNSKHWKDQYKLSLTLHNAAAEIEYYCGNFDRVDALVGKVLRGAQSYDDTLVARFTRIYSLGSRCEMTEGFNEGFNVLKELGEPLPASVRYHRVQAELALCKWMLRRTSEQTILELPLLTDTKKLTAMRLMIIMHSLAFNRGNEYGPILAARAVRMILTFGMNELGMLSIDRFEGAREHNIIWRLTIFVFYCQAVLGLPSWRLSLVRFASFLLRAYGLIFLITCIYFLRRTR
jgi:predicted ATPase